MKKKPECCGKQPLLKIDVGPIKVVADAIRKDAPKHCHLDDEFYEEQIAYLVERLETARYSLNLGYTSWRPLGDGKWEAGDGSVMKVTLCHLLTGWSDDGKLECLEFDKEWMAEEMLIEHCGQEEFEGRRLRGDIR